VTSLRDGETAVGYNIGFDRQAALEIPLYLRLLNAVVEDAIDLGGLRLSRLSLSRTALETKSASGRQAATNARARTPSPSDAKRPGARAAAHHLTRRSAGTESV